MLQTLSFAASSLSAPFVPRKPAPASRVVLVRAGKKKGGKKKKSRGCDETAVLLQESKEATLAAAAAVEKSLQLSSEGAWRIEESRWLREEERWLREQDRWENREAALLGEIEGLQRRLADLEGGTLPTESNEGAVVAPERTTVAVHQATSVAPVAKTPPAAPTAQPKSLQQEFLDAIASVDRTPTNTLADVMSTPASRSTIPAPETPSTIPVPETASFDQSVSSEDSAHPGWPVLKTGATDIFFVGKLQMALEAKGYSCGEDGDAVLFQSQTGNALGTFQACNGLKDTCETDLKTWYLLLGAEALEAPPYKMGETDTIQEEEEPATPTATAPQPLTAAKEQEPEAPVVIPAPPGAQAHNSWPVLTKGADDLYFVGKLQTHLMAAGYDCGEDAEDIIFGDITEFALGAFQESNGMADTCYTCSETWVSLIGMEALSAPPLKLGEAEMLEMKVEKGRLTVVEPLLPKVEEGGLAAVEPLVPAPTELTKSVAAAEKEVKPSFSEWMKAQERSRDEERSAEAKKRFQAWQKSKAEEWPVLRLEDGGKHVHILQNLLTEAGYHCNDDDYEFWYMGSSTETALTFFQSSAGLPETGICDPNTWRVLLGEERFSCGVAQLDDLIGGEWGTDVSANKGASYLIGEQRAVGDDV